jgi:hypothetical protein
MAWREGIPEKIKEKINILARGQIKDQNPPRTEPANLSIKSLFTNSSVNGMLSHFIILQMFFSFFKTC